MEVGVATALTGVVQHYAWGDREFLPRLLGQQPDGRPWAELWLGTHPHGPARLPDGRALTDLTGPLPYLLKILCAAEPLSLQCHPNAEQAREGHARGVYPDTNAKPELIVALTRFDALCGIRPIDHTVAILRSVDAGALATSVEDLGIVGVLEGLYRETVDHEAPIAAVEAAVEGGRADLRHIAELAARYPGDPSVAVALLLNHVTLEPGQALRLTAGNLHAYLRGSGIELMGPSDNVVRGGLTVKPVDVDELLRIVDPEPLADPLIRPTAGRYRLPEAAVELVRVDAGVPHTSRGNEVGIALDGTAVYLPPDATWVPDVEAYVAVGPA